MPKISHFDWDDSSSYQTDVYTMINFKGYYVAVLYILKASWYNPDILHKSWHITGFMSSEMYNILYEIFLVLSTELSMRRHKISKELKDPYILSEIIKNYLLKFRQISEVEFLVQETWIFMVP